MNCEKYHELISDLLDGSLSRADQLALDQHLGQCLACAAVRNDLDSIVVLCRAHRGEYAAPPNERALWLRIRNTVEAEQSAAAIAGVSAKKERPRFRDRLNQSWELSLSQLAALVAAIVVVVSLATAFGVHRFERPADNVAVTATGSSVRDRWSQQQQTISYWNQRIEMNKARWSPQMRQTFARNLSVIDEAVNDSMGELNRNPHDEVSEEMLNAALNEKIQLLKEFSDL